MAAVVLRLHIEGKSVRTQSGGRRAVLGRIDLTVREGEVVALSGPSGVGKTTLLRIAGGLERDFQGVRDWRGGTIGTVFQEPRLLAWRGVLRNVLLAQKVENAALAEDLLRRLDLGAYLDAYPGTLSLGMARRVAIARALAVTPDLLLLDEPFASLDPAMAARVRLLLEQTWRARPTATLLVTHDRAEALALADRILVLGGTPAAIVEEIPGASVSASPGRGRRG